MNTGILSQGKLIGSQPHNPNYGTMMNPINTSYRKLAAIMELNRATVTSRLNYCHNNELITVEQQGRGLGNFNCNPR